MDPRCFTVSTVVPPPGASSNPQRPRRSDELTAALSWDQGGQPTPGRAEGWPHGFCPSVPSYSPAPAAPWRMAAWADQASPRTRARLAPLRSAREAKSTGAWSPAPGAGQCFRWWCRPSALGPQRALHLKATSRIPVLQAGLRVRTSSGSGLGPEFPRSSSAPRSGSTHSFRSLPSPFPTRLASPLPPAAWRWGWHGL